MNYIDRIKLRELFSDFCKRNELHFRFTGKDAALSAQFVDHRTFTLTRGHGYESAIMIAEFPCGHNLLTSTSKVERLQDRTQNKACPACKKAYYFNHTNHNEWNVYGAVSLQTRTMNAKLLHELKQVVPPRQLYDGQEDLMRQIIESALTYDEIEEVEHTVFGDKQTAMMAIYAFICEDCMAYIGSSVNLEFRWHTSVSTHCRFDMDGHKAIVFPLPPTTTKSRMTEIEYELIRKFRLADGWGHNITGAIKDPCRWLV